LQVLAACIDTLRIAPIRAVFYTPVGEVGVGAIARHPPDSAACEGFLAMAHGRLLVSPVYGIGVSLGPKMVTSWQVGARVSG